MTGPALKNEERDADVESSGRAVHVTTKEMIERIIEAYERINSLSANAATTFLERRRNALQSDVCPDLAFKKMKGTQWTGTTQASVE